MQDGSVFFYKCLFEKLKIEKNEYKFFIIKILQMLMKIT